MLSAMSLYTDVYWMQAQDGKSVEEGTAASPGQWMFAVYAPA